MSRRAPDWRRLRSVLAVSLVMVAAIPSSPSAQRGANDGAYQLELVREGYDLTRLEADGLEAVLRANPDDLAARAKLLGYYAGPALGHSVAGQVVAQRRHHILWLIEHHPGSPLAGSAEATIDAQGHVLADGKGHEEARARWLDLVENSNAPSAVVRNAVNFLQFSDRFLAEVVLQKAREREPANRGWTRDLGRLYALGLLRVSGFTPRGAPSGIDFSDAAIDFSRKSRAVLESSNDMALLAAAGPFIAQYGPTIRRAGLDGFGPEAQRVSEHILIRSQAWSALARLYLFQRDAGTSSAARGAAAKRALGAYERQFATIQDPRERFRLLAGERLAALALDAASPNLADWIAREMLRLAEMHSHDALFGDAMHQAHIALGRIALSTGARDAAVRHLLDAGRAPGKSHLNSHGPSMRLARDLLLAGERAAVVEYLELCKPLWDEGRREQVLDRWIATIRAGRMPDFGQQLDT
ncbi:MAG TPA: hypothetical protein VLG66_06600 [Alphaproteobacteria bacterium]|nr:hypothetical protein [Alphaproteobacteria bacterium]